MASLFSLILADHTEDRARVRITEIGGVSADQQDTQDAAEIVRRAEPAGDAIEHAHQRCGLIGIARAARPVSAGR